MYIYIYYIFLTTVFWMGNLSQKTASGTCRRSRAMRATRGNTDQPNSRSSARMSRWKLGLMVRINGYNPLINGVYWGYNPFTNHLLISWEHPSGMIFDPWHSWMYPDPNVGPLWDNPYNKPYITWVWKWFFHPQESLENTRNTMGYVVRGTPVLVPWLKWDDFWSMADRSMDWSVDRWGVKKKPYEIPMKSWLVQVPASSPMAYGINIHTPYIVG